MWRVTSPHTQFFLWWEHSKTCLPASSLEIWNTFLLAIGTLLCSRASLSFLSEWHFVPIPWALSTLHPRPKWALLYTELQWGQLVSETEVMWPLSFRVFFRVTSCPQCSLVLSPVAGSPPFVCWAAFHWFQSIHLWADTEDEACPGCHPQGCELLFRRRTSVPWDMPTSGTAESHSGPVPNFMRILHPVTHNGHSDRDT